MRTLQTTMKTLLICTAACVSLYADGSAVSTADKRPQSYAAEKPVAPASIRVTAAAKGWSGNSYRSSDPQTTKRQASPSLFFSGSESTKTKSNYVIGADTPVDSKTVGDSNAPVSGALGVALPQVPTESTSPVSMGRQRMQFNGTVTVIDVPTKVPKTDEEEVVSSESEGPGVVPAVFEGSTIKDTSVVQQVSADDSNSFEVVALSSGNSAASLDTVEEDHTPGPDFGSEFAEDLSEYSHERQELAGDEFVFEEQPSSFESSSAGVVDGFGEPEPTSSAVPHTEGSGLPTEHTGTQSPHVDVRWIGRGTLNIGQESNCSLIVTNSGASVVRNVVVEAAIPPGVDVVHASPVPQSGTSRWAVGDLEPGHEHSIEMTVVPRGRGDVVLNAFVRFTGYATSVFAVQEPMLQMNVEGPDSVTVGEQSGYVITVHNPGTGVAKNVVIEARVPDGLQHRSGSVPRIEVGTLNPGESRQARLNLSAIAGGDYRLAVRSVASGGLHDEATVDVSVAEPRLEVAISGPTEGLMEKPAEYRVTVTNSGNVPSINVRAKYKIPEGFRFLHADRGGVLQEAEHLVDWFVGTLQPGETSDYHVTLTAGTAGTALHRAGAVSEHTSATMVSHSIDVKGLPKLSLGVSTAESTTVIGDETVVQIVISNEGGIAASRVGLFCELPSGLEFVAAGGPSEHLADNGVVIFRSLAGIEAGETVTYRVKARCVRYGDHRIRARVASESLTVPVNGESTVTGRNAR